jgi:hypothetical protein
MVETFKEGVGTSTTKSLTENLQIPSILVNTNNRFCNVVQISYDLKVEAMVAGCHKNIEMVFPIVIGSVPLDLNQTTVYSDYPVGMTQPSYNPNVAMPSVPMPSGPMPSAPMTHNDFSNPMTDLRKFPKLTDIQILKFHFALKLRRSMKS